MFRTVLLIALFATLFMVIVLAYTNPQLVKVDLVVAQFETVPLWVVMIAACVVGSLLATLVFGVIFFSLYFGKRSAEKELQKTRAELAALTVKTSADKGAVR